MADVQKIVDDLSTLTISEGAELAKMLKAKWSTADREEQLVLFEDRERTRTDPLRRGEQLFDFYDSSASPGYSELRSVVNGWLAQMFASERAELISRMRYGGDREFGAALSELSIHAFIVGSGYRSAQTIVKHYRARNTARADSGIDRLELQVRKEGMKS